MFCKQPLAFWKYCIHLCGLSCLYLFLACGKQEELNVLNWSDYIDETVIKDFEKEFNVHVNYDTYTSNEELMAKLQAGSSGNDVVFPSDYTVQALWKQALLEPLGDSGVTNMKNVGKKFKRLYFDPKNRWSAPYMWGTMGIAYNSKMITEQPESWDALFDQRYAGRIVMLDSQREVIAMALKYLGYSMNSTKASELEEAKRILIGQKPLVLAYTSDNYKSLLVSGEAWISLAWSGDASQAFSENPDIRYIIPKEGTNLWMDNVCIPARAPHKELALEFINFLLRPDIGSRLSQKILYASPNEASYTQTPPDILNNSSLYPPQSLMEKCEWYEDLGTANQKWDLIWTEIKG